MLLHGKTTNIYEQPKFAGRYDPNKLQYVFRILALLQLISFSQFSGVLDTLFFPGHAGKNS